MSSPYLFTPVGSGGSSSASGGTGKNYLGTVNSVNNNGDFETGLTSPWSLGTVTLTSALPTGVPTFGSGASGNLSIAAVTSGKLAGSYSLSYVSSAATTAGDFLASDAFTIDLEDQAKVMTFKFYYSPTVNPTNANWSGTASNSFSVAIYDVTNAAWIIPAGVRSLTQGSGVGLATGTFQTPSNGSQFRIVVFNSVATSGAITVLFDDFFLGPQTAPIGPVVTDWETCTVTGGWSANTTYTAMRRRVGDCEEYQVKVATSGAPTAANLTIDIGRTINTSKLVETTANLEAIGTGAVNDSGSTFYKAFVAYASSTSVIVRYQNNASGASGVVSSTTPITFGSGDSVNVMFKVPISGWSSNVQMSNDTDTRVVALVLSGSSTSITSAGVAIVPTTVVNDTHGGFSSSTYTTQVTGFYRIEATMQGPAAAYSSGHVVGVYYKKNGVASAYLGLQRITATVTTSFLASGSQVVFLNAGDTIQFTGQSEVTGTILAFTAAITRLSGPAVVAATESVNARYYGVTATITGTASTATFSTKDFDSHDKYSAGTYTIPVSGKFQINASIRVSATFAADQAAVISLYKNGTIVSEMTMQASGACSNQQPVLSDILSFVAGDALTVRIRCNGTTPTVTASNNTNYFSISRVGN